jgi:hypothetical protein
MIKYFVYFIFLSFSTSAISAEPKLIKGEYITEGGWGVLKVIESNNKTEFTIFALGTNGHTCDVDGVINGSKARLEQGCIIDFKQKNMLVSVIPSQECRMLYCGMRASFDGDYLKPPKGCLTKEQGKRNENFKKLYQQKYYKAALVEAQSLLSDCKKVMDYFGADFTRNDIAITQYHLGDKESCLATLKEIKVDINASDDEFKYELPPMEADISISIAKAKRTNLKLCNSLTKK